MGPSAAYSATTFAEAAANDGSITATATITLTGDAFTGADGDDWSALVTGEPAGLTAVLTRTSSTVATLSFTGNATNHANADDNLTLVVTFTNAEITSGDISVVTGINKAAGDLTINFADPATNSGGGGGGGGAPAPYFAPLKSQAPIVLTSSVGTIEFGGSFKVTLPGGESTGALTYSSSRDALCAVDVFGNVTALGKGTCTITATKAGDSTYASATSNSVTVTVTDKTVAGVVAVEELIVPTLSISKPVAGTTTLRFKIDPIYSGDKVLVLLGTKVNGKTTYKTLGSATVSTSGAVTFKSKVKFNKGNLVRLKYGSTVIITKTV